MRTAPAAFCARRAPGLPPPCSYMTFPLPSEATEILLPQRRGAAGCCARPRAAPGGSGSTWGPEMPGKGSSCQASPAPAPLRPLSPRRVWFLPPDGDLSPWPHSSSPRAFQVPRSQPTGWVSKGIFLPRLAHSPPLPPPAPGRRRQRKEGAGGTSWSCGVPAGSPHPPVPVLPRLLAGPRAWACAGPGHLVSGRGSVELRVAPTHAPAESPGTPSRGTGPAPAATGRRETLLALRRGHGAGRAGCPQAAVPGQSHLRRLLRTDRAQVWGERRETDDYESRKIKQKEVRP